MKCANSSGKVFGEAFIDEKEIIINNQSKPLLTITDQDIVKRVKAKDTSVMLELFDDYCLCIGEIAALFSLSYHLTNKIIKQLPTTTSRTSGRRNPSFGTTFSEERLAKMSDSHKGRVVSTYERTPEIRQRISDTLKRKYASGEIVMDPKKYSDAWVRGCYKDAKMGRGIQGHFYSTKMQEDFYFRSLLELNFFLLFEEDPRVHTYIVEPFQIRLSESSHYTPDALVNNDWLIEFKPKDHLKYTDADRFLSEVSAAEAYCYNNNKQFKVLYDTDIDFSTDHYKRFLKDNPQIIKQFNIRFNDESRVYN